MFANHCTACAKRQLIFPGQIKNLSNTDAGIVVTYTCWCGSEQSWSPAGRTLVAA